MRPRDRFRRLGGPPREPHRPPSVVPAPGGSRGSVAARAPPPARPQCARGLAGPLGAGELGAPESGERRRAARRLQRRTRTRTPSPPQPSPHRSADQTARLRGEHDRERLGLDDCTNTSCWFALTRGCAQRIELIDVAPRGEPARCRSARSGSAERASAADGRRHQCDTDN